MESWYDAGNEILCARKEKPSPGGEGFLPDSGKNLVFDDIVQLVQLFLLCIPAQGNPEGGIHLLGIDLHGGEHMAAVSLGAGGAGGDADVMILQNVDGILGGHAGNGNGQHVGGFVAAVDLHTGT